MKKYLGRAGCKLRRQTEWTELTAQVISAEDAGWIAADGLTVLEAAEFEVLSAEEQAWKPRGFLDDEVAFEEDFRCRVVENADSLSVAARACRVSRRHCLP
ncbi:MAG: hypothetical protein AAFV90_07845 [Cyanobacteria bacterium J06634_5]